MGYFYENNFLNNCLPYSSQKNLQIPSTSTFTASQQHSPNSNNAAYSNYFLAIRAQGNLNSRSF